MKLETQHQLLDRAATHLQNGTTDLAEHCLRVPAQHYLSREQLAREVDALFRKQPLLVGLTPDVPTRAATHARSGRHGLIIVRGDDNGAYARSSTRAGIAAPASPRARRETDVLVSVPRLELRTRRQTHLTTEQLRRLRSIGDEFGALLQKPCVEVAGMIFALIEGNDRSEGETDWSAKWPEIANYQSARRALRDAHDHERVQLQVHHRRFRGGVPHRGAAQATIAPHYYTLRPQRRVRPHRSHDRRTEQHRREWAKPVSDRRLLPHGTIQYLIPPNIVLTHQVDHIQLWQVYPVPGSPERCRSVSAYIGRNHRSEAAQKSRFNVDVLWKVTTEEDFPQSLDDSSESGERRGSDAGVRPQRAEPDPLSPADRGRDP